MLKDFSVDYRKKLRSPEEAVSGGISSREKTGGDTVYVLLPGNVSGEGADGVCRAAWHGAGYQA